MVTSEIHSELIRLAHTLRPVGRPFVSVLDVAYELGTVVLLRLHTEPGSRTAQIDLGNRPPKIILYRSSKLNGEREIRPCEEDLLTPRERFSVAHELGHWIAFSRFQVGPQQAGRMYWQQEQAINAFAGSLLAPDWLVARWLEKMPEDMPVSPFALRYWATSQCRTSEEVVAKALVRLRSTIGFLKLLPSKRRKDGAYVLQVLCCAAGEALRLPNERSYIDSRELCGLVKTKRGGLALLPQLRLGRCEAQDLLVAWRRGTSLGPEETIWLSVMVKNKRAALTEGPPVQLRMESTESVE